ncbi:related to tetracycline resistance proteins [Fusarium mangiferae]|uniref:Related to tetracycline resistance proteins n=1 Tax=Fusarium mangiferae TaxID=192010 RepID=A0A1L7SKY0_FUSMA|nr:related to tetracycline resistance proteins [Fusarium mangiferae]CVK86310.1 related to tetracycline resistance proteins [Fusarium mangiferae]
MTSINLTAAGSATDAIDLESLPRLSHRDEEEGRRPVNVAQQAVDSNVGSSQETIAPPKWNHPPINKYRTAATFWSFLVVGMNDGSYGALVPLLEDYYHKNHTLVSLVFLTPFVGYAIASAINSLMHVHFGQRGVAMLAPLCHIVPYLIFSFHPPYPVMISMYVFVGIGNGLADAAWCSFIGQMMNSHEMSGILQACYALGATIAPLVATGLSGEELISLTITFWTQTGAVYLSEAPSASGAKSGRMRQVLKNKLSWIFAFFVFGYCGAEVALGGWVVVFMQKRRNASAIVGSAVATGFWGGMTVGRLFLSLVTVRLGEFWAMFLYIGVTIALELVFWLVPSLVVSAVAAALIGVAMGPMYPVAVVLITKVMPRSLHVGTIGFAASFGGSGGAILPFAVGAIAQAKGVQTLQPIVLAICVVLGCLWLLLPRKPMQKNQTDGNENSM